MKKKNKLRREKFSLKILSVCLQHSVEAVSTPLFSKSLSQLPSVTFPACIGFGQKVRRGTCFRNHSSDAALQSWEKRQHVCVRLVIMENSLFSPKARIRLSRLGFVFVYRSRS